MFHHVIIIITDPCSCGIYEHLSPEAFDYWMWIKVTQVNNATEISYSFRVGMVRNVTSCKILRVIIELHSSCLPLLIQNKLKSLLHTF